MSDEFAENKKDLDKFVEVGELEKYEIAEDGMTTLWIANPSLNLNGKLRFQFGKPAHAIDFIDTWVGCFDGTE